MTATQTIWVSGRTLTLGNLDKVFYPSTGFTKGDVIDYYVRVAPVLLPHLQGRAITLKRYPDGITGNYFYEKRCPAYRPEWLHTARIHSEQHGDIIEYCMIDDLPSLVWATNLANLELHTFLAFATNADRPTVLVFDLDPGPPAGILECCAVALSIRSVCEHFGLECLPKTSGAKGVQVYVPLNTATTFAQTKRFARTIAEILERRYPQRVVSSMAKPLRRGKVFVDWSQNDAHKTTVCVYSLRAMEGPTVSTPLTWQEVETAVQRAEADSLRFEAPDLLVRINHFGDVFAPVLSRHQELPQLT